LTALLTVIGFSVHDTIVVFDRIRENMIRHRGEDLEVIVNHSITQTLDRSINTQLTVMFTLLAMVLFGGVTIRHFVTILLMGIFSGTYSSIFNAPPILVVWEKREWRTWFRRQAPAAA
jgi:preprotein translocase subunit SecF